MSEKKETQGRDSKGIDLVGDGQSGIYEGEGESSEMHFNWNNILYTN